MIDNCHGGKGSQALLGHVDGFSKSADLYTVQSQDRLQTYADSAVGLANAQPPGQ